MIDSLLGGLPHWLLLIILSMVPFTELRATIPLGILEYHIDPVTTFVLCVAGNMVPVPFILLLFHKVEEFLRRFGFFNRLFDRLFDRTIRRADRSIRRYEELGLFAFVAIPLPFTGAWTGSLIAYLFDLDFRMSLIVIFAGVLAAGVAVTTITLTASWLLGF
jgi:uncharacterized membrane protein